MFILKAVFVLFCLQVADFSDPRPCIIELGCEECLPDNMPTVTSHRAANGSVSVAGGDEVALACGAGGKFLLYPLEGALVAVCEGGRYRVRRDNALRHLLDLGCQESVFEDVLHQVEHCGNPLQGRAYQTREAAVGVRHLATLCFDADRALATSLHAALAPAPGATSRGLALPPHSDRDSASPLSILGNFNHMFDAKTRHEAERLYSDDARLNRRLRELLKHDRYCFAEQTLTAGALLSGRYFEDQDVRVAEFASNRVPAWRSVVEGNLRHVHADVAELARSRPQRDLDVYTGTHGVFALDGREVYLKAGRRFPVPRYIWTVVHSRQDNRALAVVVLNDPFVPVSEIRTGVFCTSACSSATWLRHLTRHRNYERPLLGLVFCCALPEFADRVAEMPKIFNSTVRNLF